MYHGILVPSRYDHSNYNEFLSRHESVNYQSISIGFGAIVTGLIAIIIGECVGVLFAIEANTRQTAAKLFAISTVPRSATPILAKPKASIQGDPDDQ